MGSSLRIMSKFYLSLYSTYVSVSLFVQYYMMVKKDSKVMVPYNKVFILLCMSIMNQFQFCFIILQPVLAKAFRFHKMKGKGHWQNYKMENFCSNMGYGGSQTFYWSRNAHWQNVMKTESEIQTYYRQDPDRGNKNF